MPKREKVPATNLAKAGQVKDLLERHEKRISRMTGAEVHGITSSARESARFAREYDSFLAKFSPGVLVSSALERWERVYRHLGRRKIPSLSRVVVPAAPQGITPVRLIVAVEELLDWFAKSPKKWVFQKSKALHPTWKYTSDSLDVAVPEENDERKLSMLGTHAFWVRDILEADPDLANLSAEKIREKGISTEGLLDRLLHEADYFLEHGEHMDQVNWTLCSGSRCRGGGVPGAHWYGDGFGVGWDRPSDADPGLRSRRVYL